MSLSAHEIILRPVISEKSMDEAQRGKYTFAVHDDASKIQIEAAVEEIFKVEGRCGERADDQVKGKARRDASGAVSAAERPPGARRS